MTVVVQYNQVHLVKCHDGRQEMETNAPLEACSAVWRKINQILRANSSSSWFLPSLSRRAVLSIAVGSARIVVMACYRLLGTLFATGIRGL